MTRTKRIPKKRKKLAKEDDEVVGGHDSPDPEETEDFFYDDVDKFHSNREQILLNKPSRSSDEESEGYEQVEEILGLDVESSEDSDDEDYNEDGLSSSDEDTEKGIPSEKAWGKRKKVYYDADQNKEKDLDSEEEETLDKEEEVEVLMLQQNMAARLDEDDFDIEDFELMDKEGQTEQQHQRNEKVQPEKIVMDLSKLSNEEKLKLLAKDSPELFELVNDVKEKFSEVLDRLRPLVQMARSGKITNPQGVKYLEMKHQLIMNYIVNVYFYLLLKASQTPVKNHPVIERLVQYRELLQQFEPFDVKLQDDIENFLKKFKDSADETLNERSKEHDNDKVQKKKGSKEKVMFSSSKTPSKESENDDVLSERSAGKKRKRLEGLDPLSYYEAIRDMKKKRKDERVKAHAKSLEADVESIDDGDIVPDGKRGITYQISKNKGLTPKRKKDVRNPRLKHRKKFVKAKIKRKSQTTPVVKEITRYGGESTGIKTHLTRGIKIK